MTNEQLAGFIKQGGNDELIPLLWENIKKYMYMRAERYYSRFKSPCDKAGTELWDIKQACYSAFLKAVEGYKPEQECNFISYLNYPFKNAVRELLGIRTAHKDLLNECISLNVPAGDETDTELLDLLPDNDSPYEQVEQSDVNRVLNAAVNSLPDKHRQIIKQRYYNKMTLKDIAQQQSTSISSVRTAEQKALQELRRNTDLKKLADEYGYTSRRVYQNSISAFNRTGITNVEVIAIHRADAESNYTGALPCYK